VDFISVAPVKKALNKAYLRRPVERAELLRFADALHRLFDDLDETESEEHCKNLFAEFLKESFYRDRNTINTKGKVDLAIYAGTKGGTKPQVLFEVKRPANLLEMFSDDNSNSKALHELILYHLRTDISRYPDIVSHLEKWKDDLTPKKDKKDARGRKPGRYQWYEIQDDVAYYEVFESPKIIFPDICKAPRFYLDTNGHYLTNTAYAIGSSELYLLGILNSKLFWFLIGKISIPFGTRAGEYRYRLIYQYMEQVPILNRKEAEADPARSSLPACIESLVSAILEKKKTDPTADVTALETEIDGLVYTLYGLTEKEIALVEGKGS
jgi:hypothetical protein